jgi:pyruvate/2-oxoglutarate dehydrogenase complex dihydrolipoamide acyltransferase (E2) component
MRTFYNESDLPLAKQDTVVDEELDHGVKVQRKIIAGTRVPPHLIDAYNAKTGGSPASDAGEPAGDTPPNYEAMKVEELEAAIAARDDIDIDAIQGTGSDGKVIKADLVKALGGS